MLSSADFQGERFLQGTAAVVFIADWCGFCRRFLRDHSAELAAFPVPFLPVDVSDDDDPIWDAFGLRVVPTVALFKDGALVWKKDGITGIGVTRKGMDELRARAAELAAPSR